MRTHLLLIVALAACFDDTEAPPTPSESGDNAKAKTGPITPKAKSFDEKLDAAKLKAIAGDDEALAAAEALLAEKPENDSLWVLVEAQALASDDVGAVLARMTDAVGGRTGRHNLMRASLALAAAKPADALASAQAAMAEEPDAAAALVAMAVLAGAELPETEGEATPAAALAQWASAADERAARRHAEAANGVAGWRAAVLRGQVLAERGDSAGALAEFDRAAQAGDPRAVLQGNLGRAQLALAPSGGPSLADATSWSASAVTAAVDAGLTGDLNAAMSVAVAVHLRAVQASEVVALIEPVYSRVKDADSKAGVAATGALLARAAMAAGQPVLAAEAAGAARAALSDGGDADAVNDAAWLEVWAAWTLGRAEAARAAAEATTGPRKPMAVALALSAEGKLDTAVSRMDYSGLGPRDAAYSAMAAAALQPSKALDHLKSAVASADASRDPVLAMHTRLLLESSARANRSGLAASTRAALAKRAPGGPTGDGLRAELAARNILAGARGDTSGAPAAWKALADGTTSPEKDGVTAPIASWAAGRAAAAAGDAAAAIRYGEALAKLPLHRHGPIDVGTVLDGSDGLNIESDLSVLSGAAVDTATLAAGLAVHESANRLDVAMADVRARRQLAAELPDEARDALMGAAALVRADMLRYHAVGGPLPVDSFKALTDAEAAAGEASKSFKRALPTGPPVMADLRRALDGAALLSYSVGPSSVYGIALTSKGGAVRKLGSASSVISLAQQHRAALEAASVSDVKAAHAAGDGLRGALVDPFMSDLSGFGRYVVVAPTEVFTFQMTTFPEQADGLRWLASIRTVAMTPDLRSVRIPPEKASEETIAYTPDFLGVGTPIAEAASKKTDAEKDAGGTSDEELLRRHRANSNMPLDLGAASRQFGDDFRQILVGRQASTEKWAEYVEKARYIHISEVGIAEDGGLELADGPLSIAVIRKTEMRAQLVIITANAPPDVQLQRARAFLDAGAESVLVSTWEVQPKVLDRLFDGFYEAINRDRTAAASAREARESLLRTSLNEYDQDDPADWGSMILYSLP